MVLSALISCSENKTPKTKSATVENEISYLAEEYPALTREILEEVWQKSDMVDYIFHELPFSMSQNNQASVRANIAYIAKTGQGPIPSKCKALGRQFFQIEGEIVLEADIYYSDDCYFYIFHHQGNKYANVMTEQGKTFYANMIKQAMQSVQGG